MPVAPLPFIPHPRTPAPSTVHMPRSLHERIVDTTSAVHAAGLKSFGLLLADPRDPRYPYVATDVVFFDPTRNRRNDPAMREAFEAQGR